jgi:sulfhydrogenase subunit gamma (sulfur reductase)
MLETESQRAPWRLRALEVERETARLSLFTFGASEGSTLDDFQFVAGQVASLAVPGAGEALIAFASPPSARGSVQFLINQAGAFGERLVELGTSAEVLMTGPFGKGFPVDAFEGKDLVFVAMGTAIGPIRSAILHAIERRERFGQMTVIYGTRIPEDFAFADEMDSWRMADVKVGLTVTRPGAAWDGATGRVQAMIAAAVRDSIESVAFVCGSEEMMEEASAVLEGAGLPRDRIVRNY